MFLSQFAGLEIGSSSDYWSIVSDIFSWDVLSLRVTVPSATKSHSAFEESETKGQILVETLHSERTSLQSLNIL